MKLEMELTHQMVRVRSTEEWSKYYFEWEWEIFVSITEAILTASCIATLAHVSTKT